MKTFIFPLLLLFIVGTVITFHMISGRQRKKEKTETRILKATITTEPADTFWHGKNISALSPDNDSDKLILYGYELISNTARYLGPRGVVAQISNGMNCQNCHLAGGTVPYGNNFGKVYATYPQFRARNNKLQSIYDRVNDCLERSLNGKIMDSTTHEMRAMYAYIKWLGKDVPRGYKRGGTTIRKIPYLDMAADPLAGKQVFAAKCKICHGNNGQGQFNSAGTGYNYPPLWGEHSYNDGAGLYRLSSFAGFVKNNMPFGTDYHSPNLTDKEAWDVAAFVNSQPRPHKDQSGDWKNIAGKPVDFPFGPYADTFSTRQHKYGPFKPIAQL